MNQFVATDLLRNGTFMLLLTILLVNKGSNACGNKPTRPPTTQQPTTQRPTTQKPTTQWPTITQQPTASTTHQPSVTTGQLKIMDSTEKSGFTLFCSGCTSLPTEATSNDKNNSMSEATSQPVKSGLSHTVVIALGVAGGAGILIIVILIGFFCIKREKKRTEHSEEQTLGLTDNVAYQSAGVVNPDHLLNEEACGGDVTAIYAQVKK